jgi:hypothetical protein
MSGYDIFEILNGGDVLWHRASSDLAEAKKIAEEKAAQTKSSFFILDQSNQRKIHVTVQGPQFEFRVPRPPDSSAPA